MINSFSFSGYRSFGKQIQRFDNFSKINLFIGQNNSGKSNILRFIHEIYSSLAKQTKIELSPLDKHMGSNTPFIYGTRISLELDTEKRSYEAFNNAITAKLKHSGNKGQDLSYALQVCKKKAELDNTKSAWFDCDFSKNIILSNWYTALDVINPQATGALFHALTGASGGNRNKGWRPRIIKELCPSPSPVNVMMIPAIRRIGDKGTVSNEFSGEGIIERLVVLQNPDVHNQKDKEKFEMINHFLQSVTDNQTARIEIPHARDTILVHMDDKTLPLDSLGTGIHEVIILAAAATILDNTVICMEEPELHLNPILQKKLVRYLQSETNNQYFITTHSAALMDTPNAEIYHITLDNGASNAERVTSDRDKSAICEDLGYHPSDLLQSNCIIWVEGPSDRIYLNSWIEQIDSKLVEGIHYSIMFYGGRLASHLSGLDEDQIMNDFISLRRLNRRSVIVIDSDREKKGGRINSTKIRLRNEFDNGPGHAWITEGREIENYLSHDLIREAITKTKPSATATSKFGVYENTLAIKTKGNKASQASKVDVARYIVESSEIDFSILDLKKSMNKLVHFIHDSNSAVEPIGSA